MRLRRAKPGRLRRLLFLIGLSRLAVLAWAWRNRSDLAGWGRMLRRVPGSLSEPDKRKALATEAKIRAAITTDGSARAAGLDVRMVGSEPHVVATKGSPAERAAALQKLRDRQPRVAPNGSNNGRSEAVPGAVVAPV